MRIAALLLAAALAAGCSHVAYSVRSGAPVAAGTGTTVTSGAAGASLTTTSAALGAAVVLTLGAIEYANNPQPFPSPSSMISPSRPAPEMSPTRRISEQDCSKPVDVTLGNLRCK